MTKTAEIYTGKINIETNIIKFEIILIIFMQLLLTIILFIGQNNLYPFKFRNVNGILKQNTLK